MAMIRRSAVFTLSTLLLFSCTPAHEDWLDSKQDPIDRPKELTREDYEKMHAPVEGETKTKVESPPIPDLAQILAAPRPPQIGQTQLVSLAVTDDVPLKDVLIELGRLADVDIEIDSGITGGVTFRARERPFNEVVERLANLAGLRYKMKDGVLRVERDTPYVEIYPVDFLNLERSGTSNISVSSGSLGSNSSSGSSSSSNNNSSSGGGGGSSASVSYSGKSDFWGQFEASVKQILAYQPASRLAAGSAAAGAGAAAGGDAPSYILNRQASTLTVSANQRQHELLKEFLKKMQQNASSQVLIEAKILEVELTKAYSTGIDWNKIKSTTTNGIDDRPGIRLSTTPTSFSAAGGPTAFNFVFGKNINAVISLMDQFGTVRTLSSPRLQAMNNQQSVLTFTRNEVYFTLKIQQNQTTGTNTVTTNNVTSDLKTIPIGIVLALQPSINQETNEVTMSIRPSLSGTIGNGVADPAVSYLLATANPPIANASTLQSLIPVVQVREIDTVLKAKSGQVMVIGGLMQESSSNDESGIPGASRIPFLGNLFKGTSKTDKVSELVILIRPTIIDSRGNLDDIDKTLYDKFTTDPRPVK